MLTALNRIGFLPLLLLGACTSPATAPVTGSPAGAGVSSAGVSSAAPEVAAAPDAARVYADLIGRTEELPRVARSPKDYDGRSIVLYGVRAGELRAFETRYSMPLVSTDGKTTIAATDRPAANQFYLVMSDEFARDARERRLLSGGAARGPLFVECRVSAQTAGRVTSYACAVDKLVLVANDRVAESLWRGRNGTLEYYRY